MKPSHQNLLIALVLFLMVAPIWVVDVPPLVDLPNHAARINILLNYDQNEFFQRHFEVLYEPIPNMGMDLILVPLARLVGIWTAFKIFLSVVAILFFVGCQIIASAVHGRYPTVTSLIAPFFLYGGTFFYGYLNYILSVAVFLFTFGLWLRWRESMFKRGYLVLLVLVACVYLSHLSSFAFLALAIIFYNLFQTFAKGLGERSFKRWLADASLFVLPSIAFLLFIRGSGTMGKMEWEGAWKKIIVSLGPFLSYDPAIDLICYSVVFAGVLFLFFKGGSAINKPLLFVAVIFFILFLPAPTNLFTAGDADSRIILPAFCLLFLAFDTKQPVRNHLVFALVFVALLGIRQSVVAFRWHGMSKDLLNVAEMYKNLPPNSMTYVTYGDGYLSATPKTERIRFLSIGLANIDRGVIWPRLFAIRGQQPLVFRAAQPYAELSMNNLGEWDQILSEYDHVWAFRVSDDVRNQLAMRGTIIAESGDILILRKTSGNRK